MKIGIDCRNILNVPHGEKAGVGHYNYYLVKHLLRLDKKNQYILFFDHRFPDPKEFRKKNTKILHFPWSQYKKYLPVGYSHYFVAKLIEKEKLDIFHAPANTLPLSYHGKTVVTVHDLAIYRHPEWFPAKQNFAVKISVPKSIFKADVLIAVSQSTKKDIISHFKIPKSKIKVIYEGFEKEKKISQKIIAKTKRKYKIGKHFVFCLSTLEPRKNMERLIQAFDELLSDDFKKYQDCQLIIAGAKGWRYAPIFKAIKNAKCGRIRYLGYLTKLEKLALSSSADCFCFPSLWEGFGLPVLESMAMGTPVIVSKTSSLPEIVEKAGILINPLSKESIKKGLVKFLKNKRNRNLYSKKSIKQARKFTWDKCARETLKVYKSLYRHRS